jgi:GDP-L-fucose synthase
MELKDKNVIITGANGLVGLPAVKKCIEEGAKKVYAVDIVIGDKLAALQNQYPNQCEIIKTDLTYLHNCENLFKDTNINIVLHIAGVKGSPARSSKQPCDYLFPMLMFNTNMIKSAFDAKVDWFVYLSSVGVYQPTDVMREEDVWVTVPSKNDWYPGWTKRMGEATLESLAVQYDWTNWTVIRPSNIYGTNDNFAPDATVISTNIWKLFNVEGNDIVCWGNGSAKRDFVFGDDVAQASIDVVKKEVRDIINFGCGEAVTIKETIETIVDCYKEISGVTKNIVWDETKMNGDPIRCLSPDRQIKYGILPKVTLREGIKETILSYKEKLNK